MNFNVEKKDSGAYEISTVIHKRRLSKVYMGYSKKEAINGFKKEITEKYAKDIEHYLYNGLGELRNAIILADHIEYGPESDRDNLAQMFDDIEYNFEQLKREANNEMT